MSTEAINIILNLSPDGTVLSFSVQNSVFWEGLTKVESESDFQDSCPTCTCRISVYTRPAFPELKTEPLFDEHNVSGQFLEEIHSNKDDKAIVDLYFSAGEEEKPNVDFVIENAKEELDVNNPRCFSQIMIKKEIPIECLHCNEVFFDETTLTEHRKRHGIVDGPSEPLPDTVKCRNLGPYECDLFNVSFVGQDALTSHREEHQNEVYICNFCGGSHSSKCKAREHIFSKHVRPFACTQCTKRFGTKRLLRMHLRRHTKTISCPTCKKLFAMQHELKAHINAMHTELAHRQRWKCEICGKVLLRKYNLKVHMNTHKEVTKFKCRYCSKCMTTAYSLKQHEMIHTGERPFTCQYCDKKFQRSSVLKDHIRLHTRRENVLMSGKRVQEANQRPKKRLVQFISP